MAFVRDEYRSFAAIVVPLAAVSQFLLAFTRHEILDTDGQPTWMRSVASSGVYSSTNFESATAWAAVPWSLASIVIASAMAICVHRWVTTPSMVISRKALGRRIMRRLPAVVMVWLGVHIVELAGLVYLSVLVVPWVVVTIPVLFFESLSAPRSIRRSMALTRRRYWAVAGTALLVTSVCVGLSVAAAVLPKRITGLMGITPAWWIWGVMGTITASITMPLIGATSAFLYLDLRSRHEGLDIELAMVDCFENGDRRG